MGITKEKLAEDKLNPFVIFPNRVVLECDETNHIHYRNIRIEVGDENFNRIADAFEEAKKKKAEWKLSTQPGQHIEIGRAMLNPEDHNKSTILEISRDLNQYKLDIYGGNYDNAEFTEDEDYIHIHWREMRIEMSKDDFKQFAYNVAKAREKL